MGEVRASARLRNFLDVGLAERGQGDMLEQLDLVVDCGRKTLTPRPESPNLPLLKLK